MRRFLATTLVLCAIHSRAGTGEGRVVGVTDGDTITVTGSKYHRKGCRSLRKSSKKKTVGKARGDVTDSKRVG